MKKNAKCQLGRFCPEPFNYNFLFLKGTAKDEITIEEPYTYRKGELPIIINDQGMDTFYMH